MEKIDTDLQTTKLKNLGLTLQTVYRMLFFL